MTSLRLAGEDLTPHGTNARRKRIGDCALGARVETYPDAEPSQAQAAQAMVGRRFPLPTRMDSFENPDHRTPPAKTILIRRRWWKWNRRYLGETPSLFPHVVFQHLPRTMGP